MKQILFSLAISALLITSANAQRVYFCENYTESGDPVGINSAWTITATAGYIYVLYNQPSTIEADELVYSIDKLLDGTYKSYATRYIKNDPKKNWALLDYNFTEDGSYKVSVSAGGTTFASEYVTISWKETSDSDTDSDVMKFIDSEVLVCKEVSNEEPVGQSTTFTLESGGNNLYVYARLGRTIDSDEVILDIYKDDGTGNYQFKDTKNFTVTNTWERIWLKYFFTEPGSYEISVYTKESVWVNTCYITLY